MLGDTHPLWDAWLDDVGRRSRVDVELPADRGAAAAELDGALGNWRALLERFAEDHAPVYLRPNATVSAALRRLAAQDVRLGAFTDAPEELARVALAHLGAARRLHAVEAGVGARERLLRALGPDTRVVVTVDDLITISS